MSHTDTQRVEDDDRVRRSPEQLVANPDPISGGRNSANNEAQDSGRGSTDPSPALGGMQQQVTLPVMTNRPPSVTNRPPSATSTHSAASNGVVANGPRTTTTSRRGGRARSRSPVSNVGRPGSRTSNREDFMGAGETFAPDGRTSQNSASPANPSSAAAAAAAAAKALSNSRGAGRGHPSTWYDESQQGGAGGHRGERRVSENPRYRPQNGFDNSFGGPRNWPAEGVSEDRRGYPAVKADPDGGGQGNNRRNFMQDRPHIDAYQNSGQGQFKRYDDRPDMNSGRYGDPRNRGQYEQEGMRNDGRSSGRLTPPVPPGQYNSDRHHRHNAANYNGENREEYYQGLGGMAPVNDGPDRGGNSGGSNQNMFHHDKNVSPQKSAENAKRPGGTSRVIGTPTPIHVPRATDAPASSRPAGTPASVFRGRPGGDDGGPGAVDDDDSPQKILLSLRTPTTSFEEREGNPQKSHKGSGAQGQGAPPLSPEEPPRIQHAHHQNQVDASLFFEPQRSPKLQSGSIEGAPSFSLFNQSFDSLGDSPHYLNVGTPLDATFNSNSFGGGPTGSNDMENGGPQLLPNPSIHRNTSGAGGSFGTGYPPSQPFLGGGSSSGGVMTFGSPVNSFGNGVPTNSGRRGGNMMILGGTDARSASPTQMLSMYPSYSGGYGGTQPHGQSPPFRNSGGHLGENHMRSMSSGSFGGASLLNAYTPRSFGAEGSPHGTFHSHQSPEAARSQEGYHGPPVFYVFLRRHKGAFVKCSFLLPGLKAAVLESPLSDKKGPDGGDKDSHGRSNKRGQQPPSMPVHLGMRPGRGFPDPSPHETAVAMRRVVCAVCAFGGGTPNNVDRTVNSHAPALESSQSIFREKDSDKNQSPTTVTPSSTMGTPPGSRTDSSKARYDELLSSRYYENENRLSWEFEESPPIGGHSEDEGDRNNRKNNSDGGKDGRGGDISKRLKTAIENEGGEEPSQGGSAPPKQNQVNEGGKKASTPGPSDQPKMRYRCKLCGLPKQNHTCAYQQSLQRSIGLMVYPAVNAFTASEPGTLAPPLEDMNNFVLGGAESVSSSDNSPSRPTPERKRLTTDAMSGSGAASSQVTPDTLRSGKGQMNSPGSSSLSTGTATPQGTPYRTPKSKRDAAGMIGEAPGSGVKRGMGGAPGSANRPKRPRSHLGGGEDTDLLFVDAMELKPEQFRLISTPKHATLPDAYTYPALPLPYAQRKRLSDNLFALSKEVPQLTDECAVVLREAREKDMWDLAVAELMTQVVVIIHCHDGDSRFEGLRQYLLTLGISC